MSEKQSRSVEPGFTSQLDEREQRFLNLSENEQGFLLEVFDFCDKTGLTEFDIYAWVEQHGCDAVTDLREKIRQACM
jgi:hypothetical protein